MILLVGLAVAASPQMGLLVCPDPGSCAEDAAYVASVGDGGPGGFETLDFDGAFGPGGVPDGLAALGAFRAAVGAARDDAERGRWAAVMAECDAAIEALGGFRGTVAAEDLFELYWLRGVAGVERGADASYAYSFRQAAAIADGAELPRPYRSEAVDRAWLDEARKRQIAGRGALTLEEGPPGTRWYVNGRRMEPGTFPAWPGNHRVTAVAPGRVRTWRADAPVLPGRTSTLRPVFDVEDDAVAVYAALSDAVEELAAPPSVEDLLASWCARVGAAEVRLMRVDEVRGGTGIAPVTLSPAPLDRPVAAAGEALDLGDGIPTTVEGEVAWRYAAPAEAHIVDAPRLRVVFFDPLTRRFSADPKAAAPLAAAPERVRLGVHASWVGMMGRTHAGADLDLLVPVGPIAIEARLGLVRADQPYNLYAEWVDRQLYHLGVAARWAPGWTVAPYVALGAEVYVPAAVGGRLAGGVQAKLGRGWVVNAEGAFGVLDTGLSGSAGAGLARSF